ncbi:MAG: hypothetical protein ACOWWH_08980 [Eubacteriaceae bacterium]
MNIIFEIDKIQFINFHKKYIMGSNIIKSNLRRISIFLIIAFTSSMLVSFSVYLTFILLILLIFTILIIKKIFPLTLRRKLSTLFKTDLYKNTFAQTELNVMETGIKTNTHYGSKSFTWKSLYDLSLTEEYFIIRTVSDEILYIPCKSINIDEFTKIIQNYSNIPINKRYPTDIKYKRYFA